VKLNWLDMNLITSPVYYTLATSEKILKAELKRLKAKGEVGISSKADASTNFLENKEGESLAIVCLFDHSKELLQIYALLVHEAVHIYQEIRKIMGENEPGHEFEAYTVQRISQNLFYEYNRQVRGKHGKRT